MNIGYFMITHCHRSPRAVMLLILETLLHMQNHAVTKYLTLRIVQVASVFLLQGRIDRGAGGAEAPKRHGGARNDGVAGI